MAYFATGQDLFNAVARVAEEDAAATSYTAAIKEAITQAYWEAWSYAPWPFAVVYPPKVLQTVAAVDVTVTVTQGSVNITFSAVIAATMAGRKLVVDADGVIYRIATHTAGTNVATLDAAWTGESGTGAGTIFQDEYTLPVSVGGQTIIKPFRFWFRDRPDLELDFVSKEELDRDRGLLSSAGAFPTRCAMVTDQILRLSPWTEDAQSIEFDHVERQAALTFDGVAGTDTPRFPPDDRVVIADLAAGRFMTEKRMYASASARLQMAEGKLIKMVAQYLPTRHLRMRARRASSVGAL